MPNNFLKDFLIFRDLNGDNSGRTICCLISQFVNMNIRIDIPTIRKICLNSEDEKRRLKELLEELG